MNAMQESPNGQPEPAAASSHHVRVSAIVVSALLAVGVGVFALPTSAATRHARCHPGKHEVIGRKGSAVVFYRAGSYVGEYPGPSVVFGCRTRSQRPVALVRFQEGQTPAFEHLVGRNPVFAGKYAALAFTDFDVACGKYMGNSPLCETHWVASYDLRNGHVRSRSRGAVAAALAVANTGWIAWVAPSSDALHAVDSHGERTLDPGPVDPHSLTIGGHTVKWSTGGTAHNAKLD